VSSSQRFQPLLALPGDGCVYEYDVVGSMTRVDFSCQGSGETLIQPVLDSQLKVLNLLAKPPQVTPARARSLHAPSAGRADPPWPG